MNQYETDLMAASFLRAGYKIIDFKQVCDVYVINTCTVTQEANRKSRQFIRQAKRKNPHAVVIAAGCVPEIQPELTLADIVVGNKKKENIVDLIDSLAKSSGTLLRQEDFFLRNEHETSVYYDETKPVVSREETRAVIKIEDGCNNFCSYCIIPYARGRVRSRRAENILMEANDLANAGFKEIILTGIHLLAFTTEDLKHSQAVLDIAERIANIPGIERIRLGSLEPESVTDDFIDRLGKNPKLCPHFHLSLQSGSNRILEKMNRNYTTSRFSAIVERIYANNPRATVTTDIITGFPGETKSDHRDTLLFCESMAFLDMHVFQFSKREGTRAAAMPHPISPAVMNKRSGELIDLACRMRANAFDRFLHQEASLLIETIDSTFAYGYTDNYIPVKVSIHSPLARLLIKGEIIDVLPTAYDKDALIV